MTDRALVDRVTVAESIIRWCDIEIAGVDSLKADGRTASWYDGYRVAIVRCRDAAIRELEVTPLDVYCVRCQTQHQPPVAVAVNDPCSHATPDRAANDPRLLARGQRPCLDCGRPHDSWYDPAQPGYAPTWKDRADGHPYRPQSWELIARTLANRVPLVTLRDLRLERVL